MTDLTGMGRRSRREWAFDVGAFLIAVAIGLVAYDEIERVGTTSELLLGVDFLAGCAACLAVWWRRRWPLGLALAIAPLAAFSAMAGGATAVALFGLAVRRPLSTVAPVTALYLLLLPTFVLLRPDDGAADLETLILGTVTTLGVVGWGMYVRTRHQLVASLGDRADRAEADQHERVEAARRSERARIAREMHDVLGHRLSLLSLHAGALEYGNGRDRGSSASSAAVIRESAHQAMDDLRTVVGLLREDGEESSAAEPEAPQPTLAELPNLLEECRRSGMQLRYEVRIADFGAVPEGTGRQAYRIIQEGLTNARKHARSCAVTVCLSGSPGDGLDIEIVNRLPIGAPVTPPEPWSTAGTGLLGIAERAELAGGRVEHGLTGGGHFRLRVQLPWPS